MSDANRRLAAVALEAQRRGLVKKQLPVWVRSLHPKQMECYRSLAKRNAVLSGRRAGKSFFAAIGLIAAVQEKKNIGAYCLYVALNRPAAKRILWPMLLRMNTLWALRGSPNESDLTIKFSNQNVIWLAGCDDEPAVETFRGLPYRRVFIDEAASFRPYLKQLVNDALTPGLMDVGGDLTLMGTPSAACAGYFFDITTGNNPSIPQWPTYHWTALDNPHVPGNEFFVQVLAENGWKADNPTFQREYLGRWVRDEGSLVYPYHGRWDVSGLDPSVQWSFVLAIDIGFVDAAAFVILAYSREASYVVVVESWKKSGMTPSELAIVVEKLREKYTFAKIVVDSGGMGKAYVEEARRRFGTPMHAAEKTKKMAFVAHMAGDLRRGAVRIIRRKNLALLEEMSLLQWNDDRSAFDDRFADHLCDALLYGWRDCQGYLYKARPGEPPEIGSDQWIEQEAKKMKDAKTAASKSEFWWRTKDGRARD